MCVSAFAGTDLKVINPGFYRPGARLGPNEQFAYTMGRFFHCVPMKASGQMY